MHLLYELAGEWWRFSLTAFPVALFAALSGYQFYCGQGNMITPTEDGTIINCGLSILLPKFRTLRPKISDRGRRNT